MKLIKSRILSGLTIFCLILFAVAITPRQFLHDLCKEHKHTELKHTHNDQTQLNESDYYCGYNTPVTTSPAILESYIDFTLTSFLYKPSQASLQQNICCAFLVHTDLRGPPMNGIV